VTHNQGLMVILLCAFAGCNGAAPSGEQVRSQAGAVDTAARPRLPKEIPGTLQIEGSAQPITARFYQPAALTPFYTYVPLDLIPETRTEGGGEAHYFIANFAGHRNDDAFLVVFVLPRGSTRDQLMAAAQRFRRAHSRKGYSTTLRLHEQDGRLYYVATYYPAEYGDGFGPRAYYVLNAWRWLSLISQSPNVAPE